MIPEIVFTVTRLFEVVRPIIYQNCKFRSTKSLDNWLSVWMFKSVLGNWSLMYVQGT